MIFKFRLQLRHKSVRKANRVLVTQWSFIEKQKSIILAHRVCPWHRHLITDSTRPLMRSRNISSDFSERTIKTLRVKRNFKVTLHILEIFRIHYKWFGYLSLKKHDLMRIRRNLEWFGYQHLRKFMDSLWHLLIVASSAHHKNENETDKVFVRQVIRQRADLQSKIFLGEALSLS